MGDYGANAALPRQSAIVPTFDGLEGDAVQQVESGDLLGDLLVLGADLLLVDGDLPGAALLLLDALAVGAVVGVGRRGGAERAAAGAVGGAAGAVAVLLEGIKVFMRIGDQFAANFHVKAQF